MVEFNQAIDGLLKYANKNIFPNMIPAQRMAVRMLLGMSLDKIEKIKPALINNGFIKTFEIINSDGKVDIDFVCKHLKNEIEKEGKVTIKMPIIEIPLLGEINLLGNSMTFTVADVDELYNDITGGIL